MESYIFITIAVIGLIFIFTSSAISASKKLKANLMSSFGKAPTKLEYELDSIESYHLYKKSHSSQANSVDDLTWSDLDMDKVFKRINVCLTSIGEEYLYEVLHEPQFEEETLLQREELISYLRQNPAERLKLQICLSKLGKLNYNDISSLIFNPNAKSIKYTFLYKILAFIPLACIGVILINMSIGIACFILSIILNGVVYYKTKRTIERHLSVIQYFSSMLWCCNKICKLESLESMPFLNQLKQKFSVFKSLKSKISGIGQKGFSDIEMLSEYLKIVSLYDIRNYNKAIFKVTKYTDDFHALYKIMGEIDLAICLLSFRESLPFYSIPQFHDEQTILFQELYHPLLSNPISNSGTIKNDSIITGSNASGKSTFIKALAVNGILAQTIYTCMAKEYKARLSLVITSMAVRDNISQGDSYFITEIKSLKRILDKIQTVTCTCFIDEILKGTNTIERIAASAAVLKYLHDTDSLCLVASHDIELTSILESKYDNYHFCEQITDDGIYFDYKLKQGASQSRNAIKLLHYMDFDSEIVKNAESQVDKFLATKTW